MFSYRKNAKHKQMKSDSNRHAYFWGPVVRISRILSPNPDCATVTQNEHVNDHLCDHRNPRRPLPSCAIIPNASSTGLLRLEIPELNIHFVIFKALLPLSPLKMPLEGSCEEETIKFYRPFTNL